jgi:calreticulin
VKAGSIFDNILVTDDFAAAKKFAEETWGKLKEAEKKMFDSISEVRPCWDRAFLGGNHVW